MPPNTDTFAAERDAVAGDLAALPPDEQVRRLQERDRRLRWAARPRSFALSDDVGTVYEPQSGSTHGGYVTIHGQQAFVPTLPTAASCVYVEADAARFTVTVA